MSAQVDPSFFTLPSRIRDDSDRDLKKLGTGRGFEFDPFLLLHWVPWLIYFMGKLRDLGFAALKVLRWGPSYGAFENFSLRLPACTPPSEISFLRF